MGANGASGGYNLENSLRFRSSASAYLSRTPATAGNQKTWTFSCWVKFGDIGSGYATLFSGGTVISGTQGGNRIALYMSSNQLILNIGGIGSSITTSAVFRDPSAWYHVVGVLDTPQADSADRAIIYVNGVRQTVTTGFTYNQNESFGVNTTQLHTIGTFSNSIGSFNTDGYQTEVNFVDGQALTASDFGEYNEDTGVWQPIEYEGTYGTNGFYLKGRGTDNSSNGNNWTENNFNTTNSALTTYDIMTDVPTLTDEDTANFAVINPLNSSTTTVPTTSNANLRIVGTVNAYQGMYMSMAIPSTGKWYFEYTYDTKQTVGGNQQTLITPSPSLSGSGATSDSTTLYGLYSNSNYQYGSTGQTDLGIAAVAGNTQMVAYDSDTGKLWWGYNGTWFLSGNPSAGTNPLATQTASIEKYIANVTYGTSGTTSYNFGQRPFAYTPPAGFKKLNTFNLPDSSIVDGSENFVTAVYTGNEVARSIDNTITDGSNPQVETGDPIQFGSDFVWIKRRDASGSHALFDSVRGAGRYLRSELTNAEVFVGSTLSSFDSNGFSLGSNSVWNGVGKTLVAWNWKAGGTAVSNTDGTITGGSLVSANPTAGFSIVTYTGNGTSGATIGHGLGVAPSMVIVKSRNDAPGYWMVYHSGMTSASYWMALNVTSAQSAATSVWNNTAPTSSVFTVGNDQSVNLSASWDYVAYCFADVEGYSKFGSYTGNGSADGPFTFTGFRPAYVLIKRTDAAGTWIIKDTSRNVYNTATSNLYPNLSNAEDNYATVELDMISNGFKLRGTAADQNASGGTYIYMSFASNPFKNSLAR